MSDNGSGVELPREDEDSPGQGRVSRRPILRRRIVKPREVGERPRGRAALRRLLEAGRIDEGFRLACNQAELLDAARAGESRIACYSESGHEFSFEESDWSIERQLALLGNARGQFTDVGEVLGFASSYACAYGDSLSLDLYDQSQGFLLGSGFGYATDEATLVINQKSATAHLIRRSRGLAVAGAITLLHQSHLAYIGGTALAVLADSDTWVKSAAEQARIFRILDERTNAYGEIKNIVGNRVVLAEGPFLPFMSWDEERQLYELRDANWRPAKGSAA